MKLACYKPREDGRIALPPPPFGWDDLVVFCAPRSLINCAMRDAVRSIVPRRHP